MRSQYFSNMPSALFFLFQRGRGSQEVPVATNHVPTATKVPAVESANRCGGLFERYKRRGIDDGAFFSLNQERRSSVGYTIMKNMV